MTAEASRATIELLLAAINAHDVERILGFYDQEVTNHGVVVGPNGMRAVHEAIFTAFPDWRLEAEEIIATNDRVVVRGRLTGTYAGNVPQPLDERLFGGALRGSGPSGQRIDVPAIHIWALSSPGKVSAHWAVRDDLALRTQVIGEGR